MSNRRRPNRPADAYLDALVGRRIPGGCDDCDAFQVVSVEAGVYLIEVRHDDGCPYLTGVTR